MHTSERGISLIKQFEGFPFGGRPYRDAVGVWTIGYGHTEGVGSNSRPISQRQADALLRHDLAHKYEYAVQPFAHKLNQNQFDALVSFVYNLGTGMLDTSHTIGAALHRGDLHGVSRAFMLYVYAGGHVLLGLKRRRAAEQHLFLTPALTREQLKVLNWRRELDRIRRYVHTHGGDWKKHPKRYARATALKRAIRRHTHKRR
jgi:lysozyme